MFLENCWYVAAWPRELSESGFITRRLLDRPVLMYRTGSGDPVALLDRCPHRLVPLSAGNRQDDAIRCGYHGMTFAPSGRCIHIPGQDQVPDNASATVFPLIERHNLVWIWMGDPSLADAELVPDLPWLASDRWAVAPGYTHVAGDYRLLTDNLLDLSHETYIHQATIGNEEDETVADYPVKISAEDNLIRAHRDMTDIAPPPFFRLLSGSDARIDRWQTAIWTAPGINMTDVGARPTGGDPANTIIARVLHLLTPESATSTHYFWAHTRNFRRDDMALTEQIVDAHVKTFDEDKDIIELQQRQIEESGMAVPQFALKVDNAPLRARRVLNRLVRAEGEDRSKVTIAPGQQLIDDPESLVASVSV